MLRSLGFLALLLSLPALGGCGEGERSSAGGPAGGGDAAGCAVSEVDIRAAGLPRPMPGLYWGQEIWVTYKSDAHTDYGFRSSRSRDDALDLARKLCTAVHAGADIGELARRNSNGAGGIAKGFCVVPEPAHRSELDARDVALITTPEGQVTPLIEWRAGFWFARRVSAESGKALGALFLQERGKRVQARVIHLHHRDAQPHRHQFDKITEQQAIERAWRLIRELQAGADFATVAAGNSNDANTRARGGLLETIDPITKQKTDWVRWGDRNFNQPLLEVILEKGAVGRLWPEPILSGQGVDIALVVARESDAK